MKASVRRFREALSLLIILLCVLHILDASAERRQLSADAPLLDSASVAQYEQKTFTILSKILYAGAEFLGKASEEDPNYRALRQSFIEGFLPFLREEQQQRDLLLEERALLSAALEEKEVLAQLCKQLQERARALPELCPGSESDEPSIKPELANPWFEKLYAAEVSGDSAKQYLVYEEARATAYRSGMAFLSFLILMAVSVTLFITIAGRVYSGRYPLGFRPLTAPIPEPLEAFTLYLVGMLFVPEFLLKHSSLNTPVGGVLLNIVGISFLSLSYLWPRISLGHARVHQAFGLTTVPLRDLIRDVAAGPLMYIAFLSPLFAVLLVYSIVLQLFSVDPSSGAHPIIPLLAREGSAELWVLVFLVAVVVAPIVEELLFRGALYSWLRSRCSATAAIAVSAMLFAVVHPQGALGFIPLTCIGVMLGFLREWRKTIVSPILAHACVNGVTLALASITIR